MKILFLHHQQRRHYKEEPGYNELFMPLVCANILDGYSEFVYQSLLRQMMRLYAAVDPKNRDAGLIYMNANRACLPILLQVVEAAAPDAIVFSVSWPSESLHPEVFTAIKNQFPGIRVYAQLWDYDEQSETHLNYEHLLLQHCDVVGIPDSYSRFMRMVARQPPYQNLPNVERLFWLPTAPNPRIFRNIKRDKIYDISLFGSSEGYRVCFIDFLRRHYGERFNHFGGYMEKDRFIPFEEYAEKIRQSKIVVSTETHRNRIQLKGRTREILSCGSFLLEQGNEETERFLAGSSVKIFSSEDELIRLIDYYLENNEEREEVSQRSYNWYQENYRFERFAQKLLDRLMA